MDQITYGSFSVLDPLTLAQGPLDPLAINYWKLLGIIRSIPCLLGGGGGHTDRKTGRKIDRQTEYF